MGLAFGASGDLSSLRGVQASFLRPLSAIAATRGGAVPQARITRILSDLAGPLSAFHRAGRVHGGISCDSIGLNVEGRADVILAPVYDPRSARDQALQAGRASSFNALEQYTDDPEWQVGPWTDVYSLCATCFRLITGSPPPSPIDRCVQERYVSLLDLAPAGYDRTFLAAVDQGLALRPHGRPPSIVQMLILMGMDADFAHRLCQAEDLSPVIAERPAWTAAVNRAIAQAGSLDAALLRANPTVQASPQGSAPLLPRHPDPSVAGRHDAPGATSGEDAQGTPGGHDTPFTGRLSDLSKRLSTQARLPWIYVPAALALALFGALMAWARV